MRIIRIETCYDCPNLDIKIYNSRFAYGSDREMFCQLTGELVGADGHSEYPGQMPDGEPLAYSTRWNGEIPESCPLEKGIDLLPRINAGDSGVKRR